MMSFSEASSNLKTSPPAAGLYETDFYAWIQQQASLLRTQQWHQMDLPNLIEEEDWQPSSPVCFSRLWL
ncbi:MAG: DUF29 family protein [Leptolyngbya sp. DLM2.Bin27]|nr:MAG: DUF29 family protein [Leptolyngbya sp. DLM2.Bin27]